LGFRLGGRGAFRVLFVRRRGFEFFRRVIGIRIEGEGFAEKRNRLGELLLIEERHPSSNFAFAFACCCRPISSCARMPFSFCIIATTAGELGAIRLSSANLA